VERLCDKHKFEIQSRKIERFKSGRIGIPNLRVDFNEIKKRQQQDKEDKFGAFGGQNTFKRDMRPKAEKSTAEVNMAKVKKAKEQAALMTFINRGEKRAQGKLGASLQLSNLKTSEVTHMKGDSSMPPINSKAKETP